MSHIALEEAGADFEAVRVAIAEGAHRRADYLAVNPRGLIPALAIALLLVVLSMPHPVM